MNALARRARVILNDETIDAQSRAIIRYSLETNDPWLAELVRRADAGEEIVNAIDFSETPPTGEEDSSEEKIAALAEIICSAAKDAYMASKQGRLTVRSNETASDFLWTSCFNLRQMRLIF